MTSNTSGDSASWDDSLAECEEGADTLYNRMNPRSRDSESTPSWEYGIMPDDLALCDEEPDDGGSTQEKHRGVPDFFLCYSLLFPRWDLPIVLDRMKRYNRRAAVAG
jgi:hypothetical protein